MLQLILYRYNANLERSVRCHEFLQRHQQIRLTITENIICLGMGCFRLSSISLIRGSREQCPSLLEVSLN